MALNQHTLSEQDIRTKFIIPALLQAGWGVQRQIREQVPSQRAGSSLAGTCTPEATGCSADIALHHQPHQLIAAKKATLSIGAGVQQALGYAELLQGLFM